MADKQTEKKTTRKQPKKELGAKFWRNIVLILLGIFILSRLFEVTIKPKLGFAGLPFLSKSKSDVEDVAPTDEVDISDLSGIVTPAEGVVLPIEWGDIGKRMVADGVIDEAKFRETMVDLEEYEEEMLAGNWDEDIVMNQQNSRFILNMLWAFGLSNKNDILTDGEMTDEKYGGEAGNFASTGGWSLSVGEPMNHYSKYAYVTLTDEQQELVDSVSRGIYRPCCGNSTHFPDCNHGMAMLGLLELMAANGVGEQEMYDVALAVNSYWFPQTYIDLATYFREQGQEWNQVDAKVVLGSDYSSGQGYQTTRQAIKSLPEPQQGGGGCGV